MLIPSSLETQLSLLSNIFSGLGVEEGLNQALEGTQTAGSSLRFLTSHFAHESGLMDGSRMEARTWKGYTLLLLDTTTLVLCPV